MTAGIAARIGMGGANYDGASSNEWWTPPGVFESLDLDFALDPCAPPLPAMPWLPASRRISLPADGLAVDWQGRVWLNPPYGREAARWVTRLARHGDGVALVFARTDAAWAQQALCAASAVCFVSGRLSFVDGTGLPRATGSHNAAAASMLIAYGAVCAQAVLNSGLGIACRLPGGGQ